MSAAAHSWGDIIGRIGRTITQAAPNESTEVVTLKTRPVTFEQLKAQIASVNNALVSKQADRAKIERAREAVLNEIQEAIDENEQEQAGLQQRLNELRAIVADMAREVGVKAEVPR